MSDPSRPSGSQSSGSQSSGSQSSGFRTRPSGARPMGERIGGIGPGGVGGRRTPRSGGRKGGRFSMRTRIIFLAIVAVLIILILSLRAIASAYTDYLWFDSVDQSSVWWYILLSRIILALIAIAVFFVLLWTSLYIADRISPKNRPTGPEEDVLSRYHQATAKRKGLIRVLITLFFAIVTGISVSGMWEDWILFINRENFGIEDPQFGTDIGFYVFQLPFLTSVVDWFFAAIIVIFFVTAIYHYINGGIRFQSSGQRVTPAVKAHLSVLLGVLALVRAVDYFLDRYGLVTSSRGFVDGASYTDVTARLPVIYLLMVIAVLAFFLFVYNIWRKGWVLPIIAVGLWAFVSIVMGNIYPFIIQRFQVEPAESRREAALMERNIEHTRVALGLSNVDTKEFDTGKPLTYEGLNNSSDNIDVLPLQDPEIIQQTFEQREGERGYYMFPTPLDVDRYEVDGQAVPVVLGARQLNPSADQVTSGWESERLTYTHGYGVALAPSNTVEEGFPDFVLSGFSTENTDFGLSLDEPRVYFAEGLDGYSIVNTERSEVDEAQGETAQTAQGETAQGSGLESYTYTGDGGVKIGGWFRQAMFALRFWDIDPLISGFVRDDSRVLYVRDIQERVQKLAPFLSFDSDPYTVISDGRVKYIIDAYTTTNRYPFGQRADTEQLPANSGLRGDFNYVRNSVKAVVDSFDGSVTLYQMDMDDPIVNAYRKAFSSLFTDGADMPEDLRKHIRYPADLFRVQTNMWSRYHLSDTQQFYEQAEGWAVAQDPGGVTGPLATIVVSEDGVQQSRRERRIDPYYTLLQLPGEDERKFVIIRPYVPVSAEDTRRELAAFMVAVSDPEEYGRLVVYTTPDGDVDGPALVNSKIQSDPGIAQRITLLDQQGSRVEFGDMLLVPVDQSILYVRPLYVIAESTQVPELQQVIVVLDESVVMCPQLDDALDALFGLEEVETQVGAATSGCVGTIELGGRENLPAGPEGTPETPTTTVSPATTVPTTTTTTLPLSAGTTDEELIRRVSEALEEAQEALADGDLGRYQEFNERARDLLAQALAG